MRNQFKFSIIVGLAIVIILIASSIFASTQPSVEKITTEDGAKIGLYYHHRQRDTGKNEVKLLVHGINSEGKMWYGERDSNGNIKMGDVDCVEKFLQEGYDVTVIDKRSVFINELPQEKQNFSYRQEALDLPAAIDAMFEHYNNPANFPPDEPVRNYTKVTLIGHSEAVQDFTCYARSADYQRRQDVEKAYFITPAAQGGSFSITAPVLAARSLMHLASEGAIQVFDQINRSFLNYCTFGLVNIEHPLMTVNKKMYLIPFASQHPEPFQKAQDISPFSPYMTELGHKGPLEGIPVFILASKSDIVTGWNQIFWSRKDIGYEYIDGFSTHFSYKDPRAIDMILQHESLGSQSGLFNKPAAFPPFAGAQEIIDALSREYGEASLGILLTNPLFLLNRWLQYNSDYPDESFDVTTNVVLPQQSYQEVLNIYSRLAYKKNKPLFLKYYAHYELMKKAQNEFSQITDESQEQILANKWLDTLNKSAFNVENNYRDTIEETFTIPDAAMLTYGFAQEMMSLIQVNNKEPVRVIDDTFPPSLVTTQQILVIPSGALSSLSNSDVFRVKLAEYVNQGGTVICLSQQHGYEFNALPGGKLAGYGWLEDQACHANAVYIDTYHQILSGQIKATPDFVLDGYFTILPDNSTVLLRRTANSQPCLITYPYGKGRVFATTMYEDWAYVHGQSTTQGRALVRDLISWVKAMNQSIDDPVNGAGSPQSIEKIPEYKPGDNVSLELSIKSLGFSATDINLLGGSALGGNDKNATQAKVYFFKSG